MSLSCVVAKAVCITLPFASLVLEAALVEVTTPQQHPV